MSDKLSKAHRRDLRRAFGPEAAAEVFRFVEHCEANFGLMIAGEHNERLESEKTLQLQLDALLARANSTTDFLVQFHALTFWQRLCWLVRGTWLT